MLGATPLKTVEVVLPNPNADVEAAWVKLTGRPANDHMPASM
jgi:hypothetical protein